MSDVSVSWLKTHERIVITVLLLISLLFISNKWMTFSVARDQARVDALTAQVQKDQQNVAQVAQQSASDAAKYQAMVDSLQKQNAILLSTIQSDNALLKKQQATDNSLPLPDLAVRWGQLVPTSPGDLTATPSGITVSAAAAYNTVDSLEQVPVLKDELSNEMQVAGNEEKLVAQSQTVNTDLTKQITGLNTQIVDDKKQCSAEIKTVKAEARKGKLKAFVFGAATVLAAIAVHML